MKVLYFNHVGNLAGAARSLLELLSSFSKGKIEPYLISPNGKFADEIRLRGLPIMNTTGISQFDNTRYGYYRKFRWLILLREFILFFFTIQIMIKAKKKWGEFDLIHINEITMLPVIILSRLIFRKSKIVVHVRSNQRKKNNIRLRLINYFLRKHVNLIISIDQNVKFSLSENLKNTVIHNGLNLKIRNIKSIKTDNKFNVNMVGMIHESKGCYDFVKAAKICIEKGYKIDFIFHGYEKFRPNTLLNKILKFLNFKQDISFEIIKLIQKLSLSQHFHFNNFTSDFNSIYSNQNILCFTSLLESPGRPVFEAAHFKVPCILAISNPMNDTFINGVTGLTYLSSDYRDLAEKIIYMYNNPEVTKKMGEKAYLLANKNFNSVINAKKVLNKYQKIIKT